MNKPIHLGVIMDAVESIKPEKDTTYAMLLEAQKRQWPIRYLSQGGIHLRDGQVLGCGHSIKVQPKETPWYKLGPQEIAPLNELDVILLRKDPPFDLEYLYTTQLLEIAEQQGVRVINSPSAVRDANEKLFATWFPQCMATTLVTRQASLIHAFHQEHGDIVLKPLNEMGGRLIYRITEKDPNINAIISTLTQEQTRTIMAQRFIPEINQGDKRIIMIDGNPIPYALARVPAPGDFRGNLAAGGKGHGVELTKRDRWICEQIGPVLKEKGLLFVGLDVIGDYLTEINVTSPTCVRELDSIYQLNISAQFLDVIDTAQP